MFKLARIAMWINDGWSGKREFAFIMVVFAMFLTLLFLFSDAEADLKADLIFYWIVGGFLTGLAAFGFEAFITQYLDLVRSRAEKKQEPDPHYLGGDYPQ